MSSRFSLLIIIFSFVLGSVAITWYSWTGPEVLPDSQGVWSKVEEVRQDLRFRKLALEVGATKTISSYPFEIAIHRLENLDRGEPLQRYVVRLRPLSDAKYDDRWASLGVEVAIVEGRVDSPVGEPQIVAFRKIKDLQLK